VQRDVVSRRRQVLREKTVLPPERPAMMEVDTIEEEVPTHPEDEVISDDGHKKVVRRRKKRRKSSKGRPLLLSAAWIVIVTGAIVIVSEQMNDGADSRSPRISEEEKARRERRAGMQDYINKNITECGNVLNQFWVEPEVEGKAQYVYASGRVTPAMYRHRQQHGFVLPRSQVKMLEPNLVVAGDLRIIETVWEEEKNEGKQDEGKQDEGKQDEGKQDEGKQDEGKQDEGKQDDKEKDDKEKDDKEKDDKEKERGDRDGDRRRFEVAFVRDEGAWKIDWESYARYCSTPWDLFVSGTNQTTGDFRLYMREKRLSSLDAGVHIGLKFYPADYELKSRRNGESPTVLVRADSALGEQVLAVLGELEEEIELGDSRFRAADPEAMARVRVLLEWRTNVDGEPQLHLNEIKAGSWFAEEVVAGLAADSTSGGNEEHAVGDDEEAGSGDG
jgi:hypothetical protein